MFALKALGPVTSSYTVHFPSHVGFSSSLVITIYFTPFSVCKTIMFFKMVVLLTWYVCLEMINWNWNDFLWEILLWFESDFAEWNKNDNRGSTALYSIFQNQWTVLWRVAWVLKASSSVRNYLKELLSHYEWLPQGLCSPYYSRGNVQLFATLGMAKCQQKPFCQTFLFNTRPARSSTLLG